MAAKKVKARELPIPSGAAEEPDALEILRRDRAAGLGRGGRTIAFLILRHHHAFPGAQRQ